MPNLSKRPPLFLLIAMTAVGPFALNAFVPSIPQIVVYFQSDLATAQQTLTLFLIGLAAGQLIYGPLSDRYGRRWPLLVGLSIGFCASIYCAAAQSATGLNIGRIFQATGLCAGTVLGRAIVRDCFGREGAASMLGYVTMAMAVVPAIAPSVGGYLDGLFGWRASFIAMAAFAGVILLWSFTDAKETNLQPTPEIGLFVLATSYRRLFSIRPFVGYALNVTFSAAAFFSFLAGAPYLTVTVLQESPLVFGLCFAGISIAYMIGNFVTGRLSTRLGVERMVSIGMRISLPSACALIIFAQFSDVTLITIFLPMAGVAIGNGISQPSGTAGAISVDPQLTGAASGLVGCLQMAGGALATLMTASFQNDGLWPLGGMMSGCLALATVFFLWGKRRNV